MESHRCICEKEDSVTCVTTNKFIQFIKQHTGNLLVKGGGGRKESVVINNNINNLLQASYFVLVVICQQLSVAVVMSVMTENWELLLFE